MNRCKAWLHTDIIFELRNDIDDFELERHIEFEDSGEDRLDVDEDDRDEEFELSAGGSYSFNIEFKNLDEIAIKDHVQSNALSVQYNVVIGGTTSTLTETFDVRIKADKDNVDVEFRQDEFEITVERGDNTDFELDIKNNEEFDVDNLTFVIGDDFELKTDSSEDLSSSQFEFEETGSFEVQEGTEEFRVDFDSNNNDVIGTYEGTFILEYKGDEIDEIPVTIRITDGVFIKSVTPEGKARPDENLKIDVLIDNNDKTQNIKVTGRINNVNSLGTDLVDSETVVIAKGDEEIVQLSFKIPDDVKSNDLILEVTVEYDDPEDSDDRVEFVEETEIEVDRADNKIDVITAFASPNVITCDSSVQSKITFKNIGSNEEDVVVSANVLGTSLSSNSVTFDLNENAQDSFTYLVPVSNLDDGIYQVEFTLSYDSASIIEKRTVSFEKRTCGNEVVTSTGVSNGVNNNGNSGNVDNNGNIIIPGKTSSSGDDTTSTTDSSDDDSSSNLDVLTITLIVIVSILIIIVILVLIFLL